MKLKAIIIIGLFSISLHAQTITKPIQQLENKHPKLIVGIVVDQMRYDYLSKYYNKFSHHPFIQVIKRCKEIIDPVILCIIAN